VCLWGVTVVHGVGDDFEGDTQSLGDAAHHICGGLACALFDFGQVAGVDFDALCESSRADADEFSDCSDGRAVEITCLRHTSTLGNTVACFKQDKEK
jgi:hypothetical protein